MISNRRVSQLQDRVAILEQRLSVAVKCLEEISTGNFELGVNYYADADDTESQEFASTFSKMKLTLYEYSQRERERVWISEGLAQFMELSRTEKKLNFYDEVLKFIVKYTGANQGAIFLVNDDNPEDVHLELNACYAYNKKRFVEKRVDIGQGMLGQCYLEKTTTITAEVPPLYTTITSGLGEATPSFLLLIPLKYNDIVLGVIEMAYFKKLRDYQIDFLEKIAENIATVTLTVQQTRKTELLYEQSQQTAQILREQEETLKQNIEELTATQEEMRRNQAELDRQSQFLKFVLDNIPFPIFVKDERGRYTLVNRAEANLFNLEEKEVIGRGDHDFVGDENVWKQIKESDERVLSSDVPLELPMQHYTTLSGAAYIFNTTKIPFVNQMTGRKNILGVSIDITEKVKMEREWLREKDINRYNDFINVAGRQRMLSQKIAFCSEALSRGKTEYGKPLREAIELYDHSLRVIRYGGIPMGISVPVALSPLHEELLPQLEEAADLWARYKIAAENILRSHLHETSHDRNLVENSLSFIEANAEKLLSLNDDIVLGYQQVRTERMADAV